MEYGYGDYLPKGRYPYAFVFITLPPDAADFNIHPAKREVRLSNRAGVHRAVHRFVRASLLESLGGGIKANAGTNPAAGGRSGSLYSYGDGTPDFPAQPKRTRPEETDGRSFPPAAEARAVFHSGNEPAADQTAAGAAQAGPQGEIHFVGQIFSLFLVASVGETMYIIDQHAAHERYLFDKLSAAPPDSQQLLVPISFQTEASAGNFIRSSMHIYRDLGIGLREEKENRWLLTEVPALAGVSGGVIVDFITSFRGGEEQLRRELFARIACRSSVQDGELLDNTAAVDLIKKALSLPAPRCPHGRPVWHTISREKLFSLVGRRV